jgi:hypothetical protein
LDQAVVVLAVVWLISAPPNRTKGISPYAYPIIGNLFEFLWRFEEMQGAYPVPPPSSSSSSSSSSLLSSAFCLSHPLSCLPAIQQQYA